jgi:hypothetical protein
MDLETSIIVVPTLDILSEFGIYVEYISDETKHIYWEFIEELN